MEIPLDANWPEPLWPLDTVEFLKLLEDSYVRLGVDGGALGDEVLVKWPSAVKEEAIHELLLRLRPLGLARGLGSLG